MDLITKTPGLIHIAEEIFSNLDRNSLLECQEVNEHWGSILRNPCFFLNKFFISFSLYLITLVTVISLVNKIHIQIRVDYFQHFKFPAGMQEIF